MILQYVIQSVTSITVLIQFVQDALLRARDGVGAKAVMERVEIQTHRVP